MISDSIVEEIRAIRDEIAKECDYDIDTIFRHLRHLEATSSAPRMSLSPRRVADIDQDDPLPAGGPA